MNFTPETHQTRCGKPWRWLSKENGVVLIPSTVRGMLFWINDDGTAEAGSGMHNSDFDLIPIVHPPVELPTNLRPEIRYAMQWHGGGWVGYDALPHSVGRKSYPLACHDIPDDPMGPGNWHVRKGDGSWGREVVE